MSAARDLLADLDSIGASLEPLGDRLILRAGSTAIPAGLVRRVREAKAELLVTLAIRTDHTVPRSEENRSHDENSLRRQVEDRPSKSLVVEWLNQHPAPSVPGHCAWCGRPEFTERYGPALRERAGDAYVASRRMLARLASGAKGRRRCSVARNRPDAQRSALTRP